MAKMRGAIRLQGLDKSNNKIYVRTKSGTHLRERSAEGIHKNEPAIIKNNTAIGGANVLAGSVSRAMRFYAEGSCERSLYNSLVQVIMKDVEPGRLLRLKRFEGKDGHSRHKLDEIMMLPKIELAAKGNQAIVTFEIKHHPHREKDFNFYFLRIILVLWNSRDDTHTHAAKRLKWIPMDAELPLKYRLEFEKPANSTEYLVMCCCERGSEENESRLPTNKKIRILLAGSFDKKATAAYEAYLAEKNIQQKHILRNAAEEEAVGPITEKPKKVATKNTSADVAPLKDKLRPSAASKMSKAVNAGRKKR